MRTLGLLLLLSLAAAPAGAEARLFRGATVHSAAGDPIADADLLVEGGRIVALGRRGSVSVPADAVVEDLAGKVIIPGLVDTHSHVGLYPLPAVAANRDGNETSSPVTPEVRAIDSIWPADPRIRMALAGGITTANVMPGSGNPVGGQTAYLKLRGTSVDEMIVRDRNGEPVLGGMKMANGENPKLTHGAQNKPPMTRMGVAFLQRKLFVEAEEYRRKGETDDAPDRDLRLEPMTEVLEGRRIVQHHTHRADDILTVLRLADEFGHRIVIQHGTEAHLVADELARRGVPVSTIVVESPGGKHEAMELDYSNPAVLEAAGVAVAIHTDDMITPSRLLLRSAALAIRGGMSEPGALRAVTLEAARMLDLGEMLGSLEPGKDADLAVLSGPPFSVWTRVLETWIEGERVWDADDAEDLRYQTGGYPLGAHYPGSRATP
jgi:imidazolonepropionase-like amidohydrolase